MRICAIVCINTKNFIGKNGDLLYRISFDLKNFKRLTKNSVVIMGRKTWDSLPKKPLPNRVNIVVSRSGETYKPTDPNAFLNMLQKEGDCFLLDSLDSALLFAEDLTGTDNCKEVFIIGGSSLYHEALDRNYISKLYITEVLDNTEGDVLFPELKEEKWLTRFTTDLIVDTQTGLSYRYLVKEFV